MEWNDLHIRFTNRRKYKVKITRIYAGTSLWKFEVTGGDKRVVLDKHLYRKTNTWMQSVGGLCEKDVLLLGRIIDYLIKTWNTEPKKIIKKKDGHDWSGKTIDLETIRLLEVLLKD